METISTPAPTISPDGHFWWDGAAWQPMPSAAPPPSKPKPVFGWPELLIFAVLCVLTVVTDEPALLLGAFFSLVGWTVGYGKGRARAGIWLGILLGPIGVLITFGLRPAA